MRNQPLEGSITISIEDSGGEGGIWRKKLKS
jgi:hypothetical protein